MIPDFIPFLYVLNATVYAHSHGTMKLFKKKFIFYYFFYLLVWYQSKGDLIFNSL